MRKLIFALVFAVSSSVFSQSEWKADPAHSNVNFEITHMMISQVNGKFGEFDIQATADESFSNPSFNVSIPTTTVDTGIERRDNHLRSDDFFASETHPNMSFTTTSIEKTGEKTFKVKGDLTLRGITKPVELDGKLNGVITDPRSQKLKAGLQLNGTIDRKDFEVGMGSFPIGDEVSITINLQMAQQ